VGDVHRAWPWSERRWHFVGRRMAELATDRWYGDATAIGMALQGARTVRSLDDPHLAPWLTRWAACDAAPTLFPAVDRRCDSFSQWWTRATRGLTSVADLRAGTRAPAS
jgi:deoxyribodipyrimidine photo-lyase